MKSIHLPMLIFFSFLLFGWLALTPDQGKSDREIVQTGRLIAVGIITSLLQGQSAAIREGGFEEAFYFCSYEALNITARATPENVGLKRTSLKWRNLINKPDSLELVALRFFENAETLPANHIQRFVVDGVQKYRYYHPLIVGSACVNCHGPKNELSPAIQSILDVRYPEDNATGYKEGDFRGLVRVECSD